jgi:3-deoxy-manno-octulosonate cytidylyltransferase (CMP-KDO synthetase)
MAEIAAMEQYSRYAYYLNVQGDEPLINPEDVVKVRDVLRSHLQADVGTLFYPISGSDAERPEAVKAVVAPSGQCLYFSRAKVPFAKSEGAARYRKHVGIYAYTQQALTKWLSLPVGELELQESLEQLRLLEAGLRIFAAEVPPTGPGVDTPETLEEVRRIIAGQEPISHAPVEMVITDVDGVLTDGGISLDSQGNCIKRFDVKDGMGFMLLQRAGVRIAVISGRDDKPTRHRLQALKVPEHLMLLGVHDKRQAMQELMAAESLNPSQCLYIGDDVIDLPAFEVCAHRAAPADAHPAVLRNTTMALHNRGGAGAFREVADWVLAGRGVGASLETAAGYTQFMCGAPDGARRV